MPGKSGNGYYNVEDYKRQKRQQQEQGGFSVPPEANIIAAANHIRALFDGKKFEYGLFGGLAMLCLGSRRKQVDVHITYDDKDFLRLRMKLENDQRVRLPEGMNSLFPARILVRTGPAYKDEGCTQAADIEVNLVPPGSHGTPFNGTIHNNLVLLTLRTSGKPKPFKGLNILHLLKTSIHYCGVQDIVWDPRHDIVFLCQNYGQDISAMRSMLDQKALKQNFLGDPFLTRLSQEDQAMCYQVLLGTQTPPRMAIRPPSTTNKHGPSASTSNVDTRPRLASHHSTPSLKAGVTPELLSPPLPGKANPSHKRTASAEVRPSDLAASNEVRGHSRDSRSRYRPISAPGSRETSPNEMQTSLKQDSHAPSSKPAHARHTHQAAYHSSRPHSYLAPMPNITQNRRSMPNLNAKYHGPLPPYAFTQTPSLNTAQHNVVPAFEMAATPVAMNAGQHHLKSEYGLAGAAIPIHTRQNVPIAEKPVPLQARASYQELPAFRAELSAAPMPETKLNKSQRAISPEGSLSATEQLTTSAHEGRLKLVGANGLYPATKKDDVSHTIGPGRNVTKDTMHVGAVELDAASPIGQFIAELSVERATPAPGHEHIQHNHPTTYAPSSNQPTTKQSIVPYDSPISPPQDHAVPVNPTQTLDSTARPFDPRTQSAPAQPFSSTLMPNNPGLPSSLTISSPPKIHAGLMATPSTATTLPESAPLTTNASRYTRYYSASNSPSHPPLTTSMYQAYNPSSSSATTSPPAFTSDALSPPAETPESARFSRPLSFAALKDVDGAGHYFATHGGHGHGGHRRDKSHDSHASSASHDSRELADEYRASLGSFEGGYGGK